MLTPGWDTIRLFLHVLAATVWVGGQLTLVGLVPGARAIDPGLPAALARRFAKLSWPAFAVLVVTGIWNIVAVDPSSQSRAWRVTLSVKVIVVVISGLSAWLHSRSRSRPGLAFWGGVSGLSALTALFLGVLLAG
jgi:putative copper export protein